MLDHRAPAHTCSPIVNSRRLVTSMTVVLLLAAACGGGSATQATEQAPTTDAAEQEATTPTAVSTPVPTTSQAPPTATAAPTAEPEPTPPPNERLDLETMRTDMTIVDPTRPTDATLDHNGVERPAADTRTIHTIVIRPTDATTTYPVVVVVHGFGDDPENYVAVGEPLARRGFVVLIPAFPETSFSLSSSGDFVEQPADIAAVLDQLTTALPELEGVAATDQVGLFGHSLGGATVLGMTSNTCCRDERVAAVVASGAGLATEYPDGEYEWGSTPKLIVNGTEDIISPIEFVRQHFDESGPATSLLLFEGAGHFDMLATGTPWSEPLITAVGDFFDIHLAGRSTSDLSVEDPIATLEVHS